MLAEAFASIRFPVKPILQKSTDGEFKIYDRNLKLYTPSDFDYSPYFDIIKYPIYGIETPEVYKNLPWEQYGIHIDSDTTDTKKRADKTPDKQAAKEKTEEAVASKQDEVDNLTTNDDDIEQETREMLEEMSPQTDDKSTAWDSSK